MFSNSNAYQAEVQYRHRQLREDLARRQQVKQAKLARRNRNARRARRAAPTQRTSDSSTAADRAAS